MAAKKKNVKLKLKKKVAPKNVKKSPAKKSAAKKSPAKKPVAKKAVAKKIVAKKPVAKKPVAKTSAKKAVAKTPAKKPAAKKTSKKRTVLSAVPSKQDSVVVEKTGQLQLAGVLPNEESGDELIALVDAEVYEVDESAEDEEAEALAEAREIFGQFDRDRNGFIDAGEFANLMEALGSNLSDEEMRAGLAAVDTNGSGRISWNEFATWWTSR